MNKKIYGMNIGSSSILMIFVILCLVSFATLSIVSANADYMLSKKMADRNISYYEACNQAERSIATIDTTLQNLSETGISEDEYFKQVGYDISYTITISNIQSLQIELKILYPNKEEPSCYEITSWKVVTTGSLDYNENLPVITDPVIQ